MIKRIKRVGNSQALILDKPLMELVGLTEGASVQVTVSGGSIVLTPTSPRAVDPERFEAALDRVVGERREALRRLAR